MPPLQLVDETRFYATEELSNFVYQILEVTPFVSLSQVQPICPRISSGSRFHALKGRRA